MSETPYDKLYLAEVEYLEAHGWKRDDLRKADPGKDPGWVEPPGRHRHRRVVNHGHAVNSQKANDSWSRRFPGLLRPNQEERDDGDDEGDD